MFSVRRFLVPLSIAAGLLAACYSDPAMEVRYVDTPTGRAAVVGGPVREPRPIKRVNPEATNTAGFVKARLTIGENGAVRNVDVLTATDDASAKSVRDALMQWLFEPTFVNGAPTQVVYELKITFKQPGVK